MVVGPMEVFQNRRDSYNKPKSKAKNAHKGWPHPKTYVATPDSLANAGFFFKPSKEDFDNVQCFMCKKELGGWDEEDNPFEIHLQKCPKCPWAIARCSIERDVDESERFVFTDESRLPSNKALENARLETFKAKPNPWPHGASKNHGAVSENMAAAGFVYTPQTRGDDTATCFYCELVLSGWDAEDDPTEEHHKREVKSGIPCPFFQSEITQTEKDEPRKKTSRKSKASKKAAAPVESGDEREAMQSTSTSSKKKTPTSRKGKQSVKPTPDAANVVDVEDDDLREDDDPSLKVQAAPPKRKAKKSTKKSMAKAKAPVSSAQTVDDDEHDGTSNSVVEQETRTKAAKKEKQRMDESKHLEKPPGSPVDGKPISKYQDFQVDIVEEEESHKGRTKKAGGSRSQSRSKSKGRSTSRQSSKPMSSDNESRPPSRASTRPKVSEVMEVDGEEESGQLVESSHISPKPQPKPPSKAKSKSKRAKASKAKEKAKVLETGDEDFTPATDDEPAHERKSSRPDDLDDGLDSYVEPPLDFSAQTESSQKKEARQSEGLNVKRATSKPRLSEPRSSGRPKQQTTREGVDSISAPDAMDVDEDVPENTAFKEDIDDVGAIPSELVVDRTSAVASSKPSSERQVDSILTPKHVLQNSTMTSKPPSSKSKSNTQTKLNGREREPPPTQSNRPLDDISIREPDCPSSRRDSEKENRSSRLNIPPSSHSKSTLPAPSTPERQILRFMSPRPISPLPQRAALSPAQPLTPAAHPVTGSSVEHMRSPSPTFLPALSDIPRVHTKELTMEERELTVEQWIRREMEIECSLLRKDAERRIEMFRTRAEEVRREIEAL